jgi:adenylate kinase family enzyme
VGNRLDEVGDSCVVDGQYLTALGPSMLENADTVIWLELPWRVIFWRTFTRAIARAGDRRLICGENVETWRQVFFRRDSLVWWHIRLRLSRGWSKRLAKRQQFLDEYGQHLMQIYIRSVGDLNKFYSELGLERPAN